MNVASPIFQKFSFKVEYEFPNGYHDDFGVERFKISEALFDPSGIRYVWLCGFFMKTENVSSPGARTREP